MATTSWKPRRWNAQTAALWVLFVLALWLALRLLLVPDPQGGLLYARAQRLEQAGLTEQALRQYALLATTRPHSKYAARALLSEADLLAAVARGGQTDRYPKAIAAYLKVENDHASTPEAGQALLSVGAIYEVDTKQLPQARGAYQKVLDGYPSNADFSSQATLGLGRVALAMRDGKSAQSWLQRVLQRYQAYPDRCAEAQYHLGETYEQLFRDRNAARNAYEATVKNYTSSVWAGNAKERLGLMLYSEGAPRARRVIITVDAPVPDQNTDSLDSALTTLFAARGLDIGDTVYRGWTLTPFFDALDPQNPGRVPAAPFEGWQNAVSNSGLQYSKYSGGPAATALGSLQDEIDAAHLGLIYTGSWQLVSGYDSQKKMVYLRQGARQTTVSTADLARSWNRSSPLGGDYTLLSFGAPGQDDKTPGLPKTGAPGTEQGGGATAGSSGAGSTDAGQAASGQPPVAGAHVTQVLSLLQTPTFVYDLKPLSEDAAHKRALRGAADWLRRGRSGDLLVNGEALRYLENAMGRLGAAPGSDEAGADNGGLYSEPPVRSENPEALSGTDTDSGASTGAGSGGSGSTSGAPVRAATPSAPVVKKPAPLAPGAALAQARALLAWKGAPLQHWLATRAAAAAYLDIAAARIKDGSLHSAATALREECSDLENAAAALPAPASLAAAGGPDIAPAARRGFTAAAAALSKAAAAEGHAADIIAASGG